MSRYHPLLVALHWLLAIAILVALFMGTFSLAETPNSDPNKIFGLRGHMSVGISILVLMLIRVITRFASTRPPKVETGNALIDTAGSVAHVGLYVLVFAMCISGLALANLAGLPGIVFGGYGTLPADFSEYGPRAVHGIIAKLLMALVLLHVAGALYHQFIRKDGLIRRMWFGNRKS
ncbi:cytochrome b [Alisedimentitalea sp. MJ-SS2]|uniref:cytochrome b n=1 Tax=Aliisedimentitalea sp. MJ-SS2 TaxID=3049795 RepID=UPI00290FE6B2|nr:cytochrome b [Alisedimentitalea sp. MJ-SS2]MDU8927822.1 cytochrome b [Alisedimentitalea sp. MJ-SS2]